MHKDVSLIIFYKDDKILLQDRRNIPETYADWGFFGGKIMAGETPEQALKFKMVTPDYDIIKYAFEFLRSSQNELGQKRF